MIALNIKNFYFAFKYTLFVFNGYDFIIRTETLIANSKHIMFFSDTNFQRYFDGTGKGAGITFLTYSSVRINSSSLFIKTLQKGWL